MYIGGSRLLSVYEAGVYTVIGDVSGKFTMFNVDKSYECTTLVDKFVVAHQTPRCVKMIPGEVVLLIYCVASGHALDMSYHWYFGDREVGTNSPALWVSCPSALSLMVYELVHLD